MGSRFSVGSLLCKSSCKTVFLGPSLESIKSLFHAHYHTIPAGLVQSDELAWFSWAQYGWHYICIALLLKPCHSKLCCWASVNEFNSHVSHSTCTSFCHGTMLVCRCLAWLTSCLYISTMVPHPKELGPFSR